MPCIWFSFYQTRQTGGHVVRRGRAVPDGCGAEAVWSRDVPRLPHPQWHHQKRSQGHISGKVQAPIGHEGRQKERDIVPLLRFSHISPQHCRNLSASVSHTTRPSVQIFWRSSRSRTFTLRGRNAVPSSLGIPYLKASLEPSRI
eukprot:350447-Amorphochlora_amoeboformis.AAC.1